MNGIFIYVNKNVYYHKKTFHEISIYLVSFMGITDQSNKR